MPENVVLYYINFTGVVCRGTYLHVSNMLCDVFDMLGVL